MNYEFLPFGGGNRRCIGYALALMEMKLVIATVMTNCNLSLRRDRPILPKRRGATVAPHNGVPLVFNSKRKSNAVRQLTVMRSTGKPSINGIL